MKTGVQTSQTFTRAGEQLHFLQFLPVKYSQQSEEKWPLVVFLHGLGQRGDTRQSLQNLKCYGPSRMVEREPDFPAVVVSPQCPLDAYWPEKVEILDFLILNLLGQLHIDSQRIYMTGLSMGGYGTWHYALRYPERLAAAAPIAGGYLHQSRDLPDNLCRLKELPIWAYHGSEDEVVEPYQTEIIVQGLRSCGAEVRYTCVEGADHAGSWETAYADPVLWAWILDQRRT